MRLIVTGVLFVLLATEVWAQKELPAYAVHSSELKIRSWAFSPDESLLATCGTMDSSRKRHVTLVWSTVDGSLVKELESTTHPNIDEVPTFSADSKLLCVNGFSEDLAWDTTTWEAKQFGSSGDFALQFSAEFIARGNAIYHALNGNLAGTVRGVGRLESLRNNLFIAEHSPNLEIWSAQPFRLVATVSDSEFRFSEWAIVERDAQEQLLTCIRLKEGIKLQVRSLPEGNVLREELIPEPLRNFSLKNIESRCPVYVDILDAEQKAGPTGITAFGIMDLISGKFTTKVERGYVRTAFLQRADVLAVSADGTRMARKQYRQEGPRKEVYLSLDTLPTLQRTGVYDPNNIPNEKQHGLITPTLGRVHFSPAGKFLLYHHTRAQIGSKDEQNYLTLWQLRASP